jgi:hypothetical protein
MNYVSILRNEVRRNAERITEVINSDQSGFVEFVQATENDWRDFRGNERLDGGFFKRGRVGTV